MGVIFMADLSSELISQFAKVVSPKKENAKSSEVYGTIVVQDEKKYLQIDGSSILTPMVESMDTEQGDRVIAIIKNHEAIVTGNLSAPASSRTATNFLKPIEGGFMVGEMQNGKPVGAYSIFKATEFLILDENGNVLASFKPSEIQLGINDRAEITLCGGNGKIKYSNRILEIDGKEAIGLTSSSEDGWVADVATVVNQTNKVITLQIYNRESGKSVSLIINPENGINFHLPNDKKMQVSGYEILNSGNSILYGSLSIKNVALNNGLRTLSYNVQVPDGYRLTGIQSIKQNNSSVYINGYDVDADNQRITLYLSSTFSNSTNIVIKWFAILVGDPIVLEDEIIEWRDENG